jgi:hypothetical protein
MNGLTNASHIPSLQESCPPCALLQTVSTILVNYAWIVPVVFGVPGNILSILVANRKHNQRLSPCVYMGAMAVADTLILVEVAWFQPIFNRGLLDAMTSTSTRREILR